MFTLHPWVGKDVDQWLLEDNVDTGTLVSQLLTSPYVEWHTRPAIVVKHQLGSNKGFRNGVWINTVFIAVGMRIIASTVLATNKVGSRFGWGVDPQ